MDTFVQKQERMQYWDVAKGITILLVILAHMPEVDDVVKHLIYTFHMPFFFLANAFFIKHYDIKLHMKKSAKTLLIPYMIVCVIEALCYALRGNTDVYWAYDIRQLGGKVISGSDMTFLGIFLDKIADMFVGISFTSTRFKEFESVWIVWFLITLFVAKMIYVMLMKLVTLCCEKSMVRFDGEEEDKPAFSQMIRWSSLGLVVVVSLGGMFIGQKYAFLPWSIDVAMACLPFMWIGEQLKSSRFFEDPKNNKWFPFVLLLWIGLTILGACGELALRIYPGYILWMINAILGSLIMVWIAQFLSNHKTVVADVLTWCGRNSIIILAIHCLEHRFFDWNAYIFDKISIDLHWIVLFFIHAVAIVCSAWIVVECKKLYGENYEKD